MLPVGAKAQEWDLQSYWYGYALGGALATCAWLKTGSLSRDDTRDFLKTFFEKNDRMPYLPIKKALDAMRQDKEYDFCPLPR